MLWYGWLVGFLCCLSFFTKETRLGRKVTSLPPFHTPHPTLTSCVSSALPEPSVSFASVSPACGQACTVATATPLWEAECRQTHCFGAVPAHRERRVAPATRKRANFFGNAIEGVHAAVAALPQSVSPSLRSRPALCQRSARTHAQPSATLTAFSLYFCIGTSNCSHAGARFFPAVPSACSCTWTCTQHQGLGTPFVRHGFPFP